LANLSISSHELNTPFLSHLLYVSVSVSASAPSSPSSYRALVDSGATINLIHKSVVSLLGLTVEPHPGLLATLAAGKTVLSCSGYVSLSCTIADVPYSSAFFVAPLGAQSLILGMPYLEWEKPVIDWQAKTLTPRSMIPITPTASPPTLPPTPPPTLPPNPPKGLPKHLPKHRLPRIRPTRHINPKCDKLLVFTIVDVTGYKEALAAAINLYPDLIPNTDTVPVPESIPTATSPAPIPLEYAEFSDVFEDKEIPQLPPHRPGVDHEIPLAPGSKPFYGPIYNLSETELRYLKEYIDRMLERGWIRPSKSPFGSPILFVKKPNGSLRLCIDYRKLNAMTVKNRYPLPLISELLDCIKNAKYYTKLDLRDAFNQLRVALGDEWKTAFRTRYGHFEYLVMPFGLTNAPASMQAYANDCLRDYLDLFCIVYLDDILIYSNTLEEHVVHVRQVLARLHEYGLSCKREKCEFHTSSLSFLGFVISPSGISMDPDRITAITEWPAPMNVHDIQVFLGFANFYRRFVDGFSRVVSPITILLRKGQPFRWSHQAQSAFDELKRPIPGTKNPADGPSRRPDYAQDIPIPTGSLIPQNALRLLPSNFSNALFASIIGVHTVDAPEPTMRERIISFYPTDAVATQHLTDPQHPWCCSKDGLLLYKGLIYIPESPSLRLEILRDHHDARQNHRTDHSKLLVPRHQRLYQRLHQFLPIVSTRKSTATPPPRRIDSTSCPRRSMEGFILRFHHGPASFKRQGFYPRVCRQNDQDEPLHPMFKVHYSP